MWLDRLAGGQSQQLGSRSPLPRRTSNTLSPNVTAQRPGQSPRSSSISLASNDDSSASCLPSPRRLNGSSLRQSSTAAHTLDLPDLLDKLLGQAQVSSITESDVDLDVDFDGLSLRQLVESSGTTADQSDIPPRLPWTAQQHDQDKLRLQDLHRSIAACDDVLSSVETNLTSFRNDLAVVSADIESLQTRSTALSRRLESRLQVEAALAPLIDEISVSPETISKISRGHIDETWIKLLAELDRRTLLLKNKDTVTNFSRSKAVEELVPLLEKLTQKALERIRDFLVAQIKALRSPHINAQIIQQQGFLRFKDLYIFLHKHHATLAEEISQAYMNTMRWYYLNQFSRYEKALSKIKLHAIDKNDMLGHDDTSRTTTMRSTLRVAGPPHDGFSLGRRVDVLRSADEPAVSSYLAEEDDSTHYLEIPFRNYNLALIDNATSEYTFLAAFFAPALSFSEISKNFNYIFEPTFELGRALTKTLVGEAFDALGVLLCIRLNQQFAFTLQRRRVPAVDGYINATTMLLWPRLQIIMDHHCESVRQLRNTLPAKRSTADQSNMTAAPHMVTQRFAQLLYGFLVLSAEAGDDEPTVASLQRLRAEMETFLLRQSQSFGSDTRKSRRFLYNNYSLVLTIIGDADGRLAAEQKLHFEELKAAYQDEMS
ncbi:hypothetical protein CDD81_7324 [Ophiocordyceps australis]|uniref:Uncharacterized protein n=1 Tax=Ophiocordyceps australis TaxID=1399860 RepID=A0A2C5Y5M0_9HYPO|nr:hypothetical protein CDD81_7324 [Ophiocordyceps australis]